VRGTLLSILYLISLCTATDAHAFSFARLFGHHSTTSTPVYAPTYPGTTITRPAFEVGVNIHLDDSDLVGTMADMGAKWVRIDMNWPILEPQEGQWNFAPVDNAINNAKKYGLKIYATLAYSPAWASSNGQDSGVPPADQWQNFVRVAAERYGSMVDAWGIWNEPNLAQFWSGTADQWVETILQPACATLRTETPYTKIAGPDLSHLYQPSIDVGVFLKAIQNHGASGCLDVISHHIYADGDFQQRLEGFSFWGITYKPGLKQWMSNAGLWGKPVWITEFGWDAKYRGTTTLDQNEAKQSQVITDQLKIMANLYWVHKAIIFEESDSPDPSTEPYEFGLTRFGGFLRPAYYATQSLISSGQLH
jgi:hypothetical protein